MRLLFVAYSLLSLSWSGAFHIGSKILASSPRLRLIDDFAKKKNKQIPKRRILSSLGVATDNSQTSASSLSQISLEEFDPELAQMIQSEDRRQRCGLELIASENFCSQNVQKVLGSCLTNKYSEGLVGQRYYGGNEYIDQIETLCMQRALQLFSLNDQVWGVNVQPYSGSPANFAVYTALLQPHDRLMGLDLPSGGHLTHGFQTASGKKVSATSLYFESLPYIVNNETGWIDYDEMERRAKLFRPKLLIAGASAYPREWDYARMRHIADSISAIFMVDMAHISGLVAGQAAASPFDYADVVTSTTHKTLRGPRSGMIFAKKEYMDRINAAVFPALQGGPHNHQIGALAVALKEAMDPSFREYARQVIRNAQTLATALQEKGQTITTGGTDNHLMLWNVRDLGLTGSKVEKVLELASMTVNKNAIAGDVSALNPGGVRLGTPALTTRGLKEKDFQQVAAFLDQGVQIALFAQEKAEALNGGGKVLYKDFVKSLTTDVETASKIAKLRAEVEQFALGFPMP